VAAEPTLPDKVVALDRALTAARLAHAFGGALALAYYAVPRATVDIDVNLFVPVPKAGVTARALARLGVDPSWADDERLGESGQIRTWWGRNPIDLFFAYDPFHDAMAGSARTVPFGDASIPILAPEHLLACKVIFDRRKDWIDIEQLLLVTPTVDLDEARRWVDRIAGAEDQRRRHLDDVAAAVLGDDGGQAPSVGSL
jgi:hypothetical protein